MDTPKKCEDRNHFENLLVWGMCPSCYRVFSLPVGSNPPVFERAENLKKLV